MLFIKLHHIFEESRFQIDIDLCLSCDGITVILGSSGSGKTTLLRSIAGLLKTNDGYIKFNDEVWQDKEYYLPAHQRSIAYVFQEGSLLPHLTAQENIEYALKRSKINPKHADIDEVIELLGIRKQLIQLPNQMSGGERQRVAIASAIIRGAKVLLLDEPLASLDRRRKDKLLPFFKMIRLKYNLPIIYVTHSIDEAQYLANHILIIHEGKVEKEGNPKEILYELNESIYFTLSSEDVAKYSWSQTPQIHVRRDQCLVFKEFPTVNEESVAIKVKVESKKNQMIKLNYNGQLINIISNQDIEVGKYLWLLCANPKIG